MTNRSLLCKWQRIIILLTLIKFQWLEGRFYSKEHPSDTLNAIVVNEETVKIFGLKDPIGKKLIAVGNNPENSRTYTIIGVTKNFNFESLHSKIRPLAIHLFVPGRGFGRYTAVTICLRRC